MSVEQRAGLKRNGSRRSVKVCCESRKPLLNVLGEFKGMQEDLVCLIGCKIYLVGNTELMETCEIELVSVRSHDSDRIDIDLLIIRVLLVCSRRHLEDVLSGSLVLEDFTQEKSQCGFYDYVIVDRVREKRRGELFPVGHKLHIIDLRDAATPVNLCDLTDVEIFYVTPAVQLFNCHTILLINLEK